jgi:hypothetical protein
MLVICMADYQCKALLDVVRANVSRHGQQNHTRKVNRDGSFVPIPFGNSLSNISDIDLQALEHCFEAWTIGPEGRPLSRLLQEEISNPHDLTPLVSRA